MFNFFKNKSVDKNDKNKNNEFGPLPILMIELARIDGHIDGREKDLILNHLKNEHKFADNELFEKYLRHSQSQTSLNDWVNKINAEFSMTEKVNLMTNLWSLIVIDDIKDPYEESLYNRIGDLIIIKRSKLQKIKAMVLPNK